MRFGGRTAGFITYCFKKRNFCRPRSNEDIRPARDEELQQVAAREGRPLQAVSRRRSARIRTSSAIYASLIELLNNGTFDMGHLVPWLQTIAREVKPGKGPKASKT
jgi:hypothetical protein